MSKFSTHQLKNMISIWLSDPKFKEDLKHHSDYDINKADFHEQCIIFEASDNVETKEQLEEHIWKLWIDGEQWKRHEKRKLKNNWDDYLDNRDGDSVGNFPIDMGGSCDDVLVKKFADNPEQAKNCILRIFLPDNNLADNYRLEIVTTPEDDMIVGWTLIVD